MAFSRSIQLRIELSQKFSLNVGSGNYEPLRCTLFIGISSIA